MQWLVVYLSGELLLEIRQGATVFFRHHYYPRNKLRSLRGIVSKEIMRIQIKDVKKVYDINGWYEQLY